MQYNLIFTGDSHVIVEKEIDDPELGRVPAKSKPFSIEKLPTALLQGINVVGARKEKDGQLILTFQKNEAAIPSHLRISDKIPAWKQSHIEGIEKPGHLGYVIRKTILKAGEISHSELCDELGRNDFKNSESSGSVKEAIVILRDDRREIEQMGRGDTKRYKWVGQR